MTSRSDGNAGATGRSLHGLTQTSGTTNQSLDLIRDVYRYQILYETVIYKLKRYTNLYTRGQYSELKTYFTREEAAKILATNATENYYNNTVDELIDFSYNPVTFSNYKNNVYDIMSGLDAAVLQYDQLNFTVNEFKQQEFVLTNKEKLLEYIKTQFLDKISTDAFDITQKFTTEVFLKPWFKAYLQRYGAPISGIFEAERMAIVVENLIKSGEITMAQFVSGNPFVNP
jgi:Txe/YoeB family toxin of Txe-Axe toxin-antitoxin module